VTGLTRCAAQGLRLGLQSIERNGDLAIDAQAIVGAVDSLQGVADGLELDAVDIRDDAFDFVLARSLTRVIGVLQQCLACYLDLGSVMQFRPAFKLQAGQPGLQQTRQRGTLFSRKGTVEVMPGFEPGSGDQDCLGNPQASVR
jgi:hypothetical protein